MYEEIEMLAKRARAASVRLAQTSDDERNGALRAMAQALRESAPAVLKANAADVAAAREKVSINNCSCLTSSSRSSDVSLWTSTRVLPLPGPGAVTTTSGRLVSI